jgi:putative ABC transport system permease protein
VGIAADVKRDGVGEPSKPEMYLPFVQDPWWASYVAIRTTGDPERLATALQNEVRALDPTLPVAGIQSMDQTVSESVGQPRFRTTLVGLFAITALLLAVIGIYGVISYGVGRRTREVGIRMALGAGGADILRLVLGEGAALMAAGLAAGLAGAVFLTRYLGTLLFDVRPIDPLTYVVVAALLLGSGLAACLVPARRATRVDPIEALRHE